MNRKFTLALAVGALSIAGLSLADEPTKAPASSTADTTVSFSKLDTDHDGKISASEATANQKVADQFVAADKNQDGYLDQSEFAAITQS
ncbi:MAG: EF-hand domain-containing protein [Steroidobacteraceae bacterium]